MNILKNTYCRQNYLRMESFQILCVHWDCLCHQDLHEKVKHIRFSFTSLLFIPEETLYHLDVKNPKALHRS